MFDTDCTLLQLGKVVKRDEAEKRDNLPLFPGLDNLISETTPGVNNAGVAGEAAVLDAVKGLNEVSPSWFAASTCFCSSLVPRIVQILQKRTTTPATNPGSPTPDNTVQVRSWFDCAPRG